jgi:hypothetical protein
MPHSLVALGKQGPADYYSIINTDTQKSWGRMSLGCSRTLQKTKHTKKVGEACPSGVQKMLIAL